MIVYCGIIFYDIILVNIIDNEFYKLVINVEKSLMRVLIDIVFEMKFKV